MVEPLRQSLLFALLNIYEFPLAIDAVSSRTLNDLIDWIHHISDHVPPRANPINTLLEPPLNLKY